MNSTRKLIGAAAFTVALAGGGIAGAVLGTPTLSGAQEDTTTTTAADQAPAADAAGRPEHGPWGGGLEAAAEAIGITKDELKAELEAGKSIAQVAEAHDVDAQTVIDALVAKQTERLEAAIAALPERVTEQVNHEGLPEGRGPGGPGGPGHGPRGDEAPPADAEAPAATDS